MPTYLALLRAVNLPVHNKVGMSELRTMLETMGMRGVRSLLQSGNVVFTSPSRSSARLETSLQEAARDRLGLETDFFVRTAAEWETIIAGNPFPEEAVEDPGQLLVALLKDATSAARVRSLQDAIKGSERVRAGERHLYIVYPDGVGRSKLTTALIEKKLETRATARNWNTVLKLRDALGKS